MVADEGVRTRSRVQMIATTATRAASECSLYEGEPCLKLSLGLLLAVGIPSRASCICLLQRS